MSTSDENEKAILQAGFRYAVALTHHRHDAEDLVQQAVFKLLRRYGSIKSKRLLFVAIRNLHYDKLRRPGDANGELPEPVDTRDGGQVVVDTRLDMHHYLAALSTPEREVLFLHCAEGYTAAEIAQETSRPRGTVLSLLSRAKKKLADRFGKSDESKLDKKGSSNE